LTDLSDIIARDSRPKNHPDVSFRFSSTAKKSLSFFGFSDDHVEANEMLREHATRASFGPLFNPSARSARRAVQKAMKPRMPTAAIYQDFKPLSAVP
jgi:hypothetical protein